MGRKAAMQDPAPSGSSPGVRQDRLPSAAHAIARASAVMQQCSDELLHGADIKEAAE